MYGGSKSSNPWARKPVRNFGYYNDRRPKFSEREENQNLDIYTKVAALKAAPSVVALVSYSGEEELIQGSGTIVETDDDFTGLILTSANLIRHPTKEEVAKNILADNLKIVVKLSDDKSLQGELCAHDFHYNIAAIKFKSDSPLSAAALRLVDDGLHLNPSQPISEKTSFQLRHHSSSVSLAPGDAVIAMGRYFATPYDVMAAPGEYSLGHCEYDCKELFKTTCCMTRCGDGGPLINLFGEVIGITFYDLSFTPFMPINVAIKWWKHYKLYGEFRQPYLGIEAIGFHSARLNIVENVIRRFPSISKGVIVEKVISGSPADSAGLRLDDVIIEVNGKVVQSFLQFFEIIWDNVGHLVELVVVRADHGTPLHLKPIIVEPTSDGINSWPNLIYW